MDMMKYLLSLALLTSSLFADDDLEIMRELIQSTKKNLTTQEAVLKHMTLFTQLRAAFIADPTSAKIATQLVKTAMTLHAELENENLSHLFSSDFLTELTFFNQVGVNQLPRE